MYTYRKAELITDYVQITILSFRMYRIQLAHVSTSVSFLNVGYMQIPRSVFVVRDRNPRVPGDHVHVHG